MPLLTSTAPHSAAYTTCSKCLDQVRGASLCPARLVMHCVQQPGVCVVQ
jgi:hypothetical protein